MNAGALASVPAPLPASAPFASAPIFRNANLVCFLHDAPCNTPIAAERSGLERLVGCMEGGAYGGGRAATQRAEAGSEGGVGWLPAIGCSSTHKFGCWLGGWP